MTIFNKEELIGMIKKIQLDAIQTAVENCAEKVKIEEECGRFILGGYCSTNGCNIYEDYLRETSWSGFEIAKESLISLLQSNGIDTTNENKLLIIEVL